MKGQKTYGNENAGILFRADMHRYGAEFNCRYMYACPECGRFRPMEPDEVISAGYHGRGTAADTAKILFKEGREICPFCGHASCADEGREETTFYSYLKMNDLGRILDEKRTFFEIEHTQWDEGSFLYETEDLYVTVKNNTVFRKKKKVRSCRIMKDTGRVTDLLTGKDITIREMLAEQMPWKVHMGREHIDWSGFGKADEGRDADMHDVIRFLFFHGDRAAEKALTRLSSLFLSNIQYMSYSRAEKLKNRFDTVISDLFALPEDERPGYVFGGRKVPEELAGHVRKSPLDGYFYLPLIHAGVDGDTLSYLVQNNGAFLGNIEDTGLASDRGPYLYFDAASARDFFGSGYDVRQFTGKKNFSIFCRHLVNEGSASLIKELAEEPIEYGGLLYQKYRDYMNMDIYGSADWETQVSPQAEEEESSSIAEDVEEVPCGKTAEKLCGNAGNFLFSVIDDPEETEKYIAEEGEGTAGYAVRITDRETGKPEGCIVLSMSTPIKPADLSVVKICPEGKAFTMEALRAAAEWAEKKNIVRDTAPLKRALYLSYMLATRSPDSKECAFPEHGKEAGDPVFTEFENDLPFR